MISYKEAKAILLEAGKNFDLDVEQVQLQDCVGRVCAQDISASINIQPFDNSAMDGFAVRIEDLQGATESSPFLLKNVGMVAAGDSVPQITLAQGQCMEIMTGAPVMRGASAVVPVELTEVEGDNIQFKKIPAANANIRMAGEDFQKGMAVLKKGQIIHPQHIMPLAALGIATLELYKRPRAALLATGNELVEDLSKDLESGQIYNSNKPYSRAALEAMGVDCIDSPTMADDEDKFTALLENYMNQDIDLIISSGAVSAGKFDFVRRSLEKIGAKILFHKVKIKPGKPNLFAILPNGTLYFGLPGNPVATTAGLRFFVQPCLQAMMEIEDEHPVSARVMNVFSKRAGTQMFLKARACSDDGMLSVEILEGQASFMVSPFLDMNCWAVLPDDVEEVKNGDMVDIYPLYPNAGFI